MAENAPVMIWISDAQGKYIHLNEMLRRFWGVLEEQVPGFDWVNTLHPDDKEDVSKRVAAAIRAAAFFRCRNGDPIEARRAFEGRLVAWAKPMIYSPIPIGKTLRSKSSRR
jgi:PAS domain-containing protein